MNDSRLQLISVQCRTIVCKGSQESERDSVIALFLGVVITKGC